MSVSGAATGLTVTLHEKAFGRPRRERAKGLCIERPLLFTVGVVVCDVAQCSQDWGGLYTMAYGGPVTAKARQNDGCLPLFTAGVRLVSHRVRSHVAAPGARVANLLMRMAQHHFSKLATNLPLSGREVNT